MMLVPENIKKEKYIVGDLLRAMPPHENRLFIFLGKTTLEDYTNHGIEKVPPTWLLDFPPDYLLYDLKYNEYILQTLTNIDMYFTTT